MIEGCPPFSSKQDHEVPKAYAANERPQFRASPKRYSYGLKELIEECWNHEPYNRPTFSQIIKKLNYIHGHLAQDDRWKVKPFRCLQNLMDFLKRERSNPSSRSSRSSKTV